jgi:CheY-like chemotaxis protein
MVDIMTVEDPVEYDLSGVTQVQVDKRRNETFSSTLRGILRQDPDVVFIGEIRDAETARIAVDAALTGHLVLARLDTRDAVGVLPRLVDLGVSRANLAAAFRGVVAQRLLRRVCPVCSERLTGNLTDDEARLARAYDVTPVVRAVGCAHCGQSGYKGRFPVNEVLVSNPQIADLIGSGAPLPAVHRAAVASGTRSLREVALEHVRAGDTTLQEVERVLGDVSGEPVSEPAHVLVAEEDAETRTLLSSLLKENGFRVTEAVDGAGALRQLTSMPDIAMLIADLHMPEVDGAALLARVRRSVATAGIPVVVLTSSDSSASEVRLVEEGADDYIQKPIDPPRFLARVNAALRRAAT